MASAVDTFISSNELPSPPPDASRYVQVAYKLLTESLNRADCDLIWNLQGYKLDVRKNSPVMARQLENYLALYMEWLNRPEAVIVTASEEQVEKDFERTPTCCVWVPQPEGGVSIMMMIIGGGHVDAWELVGNTLTQGVVKWTDDKGLYVAPDKLDQFMSMLAESIVKGESKAG